MKICCFCFDSSMLLDRSRLHMVYWEAYNFLRTYHYDFDYYRKEQEECDICKERYFFVWNISEDVLEELRLVYHLTCRCTLFICIWCLVYGDSRATTVYDGVRANKMIRSLIKSKHLHTAVVEICEKCSILWYPTFIVKESDIDDIIFLCEMLG